MEATFEPLGTEWESVKGWRALAVKIRNCNASELGWEGTALSAPVLTLSTVLTCYTYKNTNVNWKVKAIKKVFRLSFSLLALCCSSQTLNCCSQSKVERDT